MLEALRAPLEVPGTAVDTKTDRVVAWQCCVDTGSERAEHVEVYGSHSGLGHNPMAISVIADRLSLLEGEWRPFERSGLRKIWFREPVASPQAALDAP